MREVRIKQYYEKNENGRKTYRWETRKVYETLDEATEAGVSFIHWREAREAGIWVSSDDGYVGQVRGVTTLLNRRSKKRLPKRTFYEVRTTFGRGFVQQKKPLIAFNPLDLKWTARLFRRAQFKAFITIYANMLINGRKIDYIRLTRVLYQNNTYSVRFVRRLLKNPEVINVVREELTRQLDSNGFSFVEILAEYKHLIAQCKEVKDLQNLRMTLDKFIELHDALPAKRSMHMNFPAGQLSASSQETPEGTPLLNPADEEEARQEMESVLERRQVDLLKEGATIEVIS